MLRSLVILAFLTAALSSCSLLPHKAKDKDKAVVRVNDKYLYRDDLVNVVPAGTATNDSLEMTAAYINNWVRQELLLKQAEDNLDETNRDFTDQIEQYRNSLIIYAYESELVKQKLDKAKTLLLSNRDADKEKLQTLCQENNLNFLINDGTWISFADLSRKIPLTVDDQEEFLRKNKYFEVKDSTTMYYVAISDYKSKESISPLNFETENIRTILLNKRKAALLQRMEDDLISNAVKHKKYEIFKK